MSFRYFTEVQPSLRVLDPSLHTITYVRSKSSLLFSVILEVAQAYRPDYNTKLQEALAKHNDWLVSEIHIRGYKSIEICQAFQLRSAWQQPSSLRTQRYVNCLEERQRVTCFANKLMLQSMAAAGISAYHGDRTTT